jgi:hypothetical protein
MTLSAMDDADRRVLEALKDIPEDDGDPKYEDVDNLGTTHNIDHFLDGSETVPISHTGGEFQQVLDEELSKTRRIDPRTRRNIIELRTAGFNAQIDDIVSAYISWSEALGDGGLCADVPQPPGESVEGSYQIRVVDVFSEYSGILHFL